MARDLNGVNQYLLHAGAAVVTAPPCSMGIWFYIATGDQGYGLISVGGAYSSQHMSMLYSHTTNKLLAMVQNGGAYPYAETPLGTTRDVWHHGLAVFAATNERHVYIDGSNKGSNVTNVATPTVTRSTIGIRGDLYGITWNGLVAEAVYWNVALGDSDAEELASKVSPLSVHPDNIIAHYTLFNAPDLDWVGGYDMTAPNGASDADGPPIFYPFPEPRFGPVGAGGPIPGAGVPQAWPRFW